MKPEANQTHQTIKETAPEANQKPHKPIIPDRIPRPQDPNANRKNSLLKYQFNT
jgi:hypothetical protein